MPGASPSSPGSCTALIHQNQSHFHELVIRFLAASGQIMYFFLHADIWALGSEANDADCLVNRPGCSWYGAGWQQINSCFVGFCLITCRNHPRRRWWRDSLPSSSNSRESDFRRHEAPLLSKDGLNVVLSPAALSQRCVCRCGRLVCGLVQEPRRCEVQCKPSCLLDTSRSEELEAQLMMSCPQRLACYLHSYGLRRVRCAGRGFKSSVVRQEHRMCPMEQPVWVTQPGWCGVAVWGRTSASPFPKLRAPKHPALACVGKSVLWGSSTDCGTFLKKLISEHKMTSPGEAQCLCPSRTYLQLQLTHLANEPTSAARAVGSLPDSCCFVLWSMKCNHHYLIALLSPLGAVPSIPSAWHRNHRLQKSSCLFKVLLERLTSWPSVRGNSSGQLCEQVFPFIRSNLLAIIDWPLCSCVMGWYERRGIDQSSVRCPAELTIFYFPVLQERGRSFFITGLINS